MKGSGAGLWQELCEAVVSGTATGDLSDRVVLWLL